MAKIPAASLQQILGHKRPIVSSSGEVLTPSDLAEIRKGDGLPVSGGVKGGRSTPVPKPKRSRQPPRQKRPNLIPYSAAVAATQSTKCPYCDCKLKSKNLDRHIRKCPKAGGQKPAKAQPPFPSKYKHPHVSKSAPIEPQKGTTIPDHLGSYDRHDAAKGWGQAYRDSGKFGSFPIHDAFGDESNP